jgi:murein DD-endopeptidase MepM/ murein hydrolase activator NlpD
VQKTLSNNCRGAVYGAPDSSLYVLPFRVGAESFLSQSNCDGFHNEMDWFGYDFDMPIGTPFRAARAGVVTGVQDRYQDGNHDINQTNWIEVTHADGTFAQYLHLTQRGARVGVGDSVVQGQVIGISGFTGLTGPREHLHFIVFDEITDTSRISLPVTFRNVSSPQPLRAGRTYGALPH